MMSRLTGMEVSNASMYDGATATAEAMLMAVSNARRKRRVLIAATVNPAVAAVVKHLRALAGHSCGSNSGA